LRIALEIEYKQFEKCIMKIHKEFLEVKYLNKIQKILNKKGMSSIEFVIIMMVLLMSLCFLTDLTILIWKFSVVGQTTTQIARLTGIQGGALTRKPDDYPGEYVSIYDIQDIVEEKFSSAGIKPNEWSMNIGSGRVGKNGVVSTREIDYKEGFDVVTKVDYRWDFTSNILPFADIKQTKVSKRPAMSEWKYNYNSWDGE